MKPLAEGGSVSGRGIYVVTRPWALSDPRPESHPQGVSFRQALSLSGDSRAEVIMRKPLWLFIVPLVGCSRFATEKIITLRFQPKENVTTNAPKIGGARAARQIDVTPLSDVRGIPDRSVVGENREHQRPVPIRATSPVADFATGILRRCLAEWGLRIGPGDLVLRGEITNLLVTEDQTYSTQINIRFRLEERSGTVLWEGIAMGEAHQWGSSFKEENYNEEISDGLKRTYANLVDDPGFQEAWTGQSSSPGKAVALTPAQAKAKILEMMEARIATETIAAFVRGVQLAPALGPDGILEWKKSGIAEEVIRAALGGK